jgi:hypothetical protein
MTSPFEELRQSGADAQTESELANTGARRWARPWSRGDGGFSVRGGQGVAVRTWCTGSVNPSERSATQCTICPRSRLLARQAWINCGQNEDAPRCAEGVFRSSRNQSGAQDLSSDCSLRSPEDRAGAQRTTTECGRSGRRSGRARPARRADGSAALRPTLPTSRAT